METDHEHGQGIDQSFGGIRAQIACEQRTVRQRELQMLGDQNGFQRFPIVIMTTGDHGDRRDGRQFEFLQTAKILIFAFGHLPGDFLHCVDFVAYMHETHNVS